MSRLPRYKVEVQHWNPFRKEPWKDFVVGANSATEARFKSKAFMKNNPEYRGHSITLIERENGTSDS